MKDFAMLTACMTCPFRFDSGEEEPVDAETMSLKEVIAEAEGWEIYSHKQGGMALVYHVPTGHVFDMTPLQGARNIDDKVAIAQQLVNGFYEMTRLRAYYAWEAAGKPTGKDVELWKAARYSHKHWEYKKTEARFYGKKAS